MSYKKSIIASKLLHWENYLNNFRLPEWNSIPDFGLYMEQVIILLKEYLDYLPPELQEEQFITAATINNYVRKKVMPEPVKKRYYRTHIAYLIIIYTLKHCLSISTLQALIPLDLTEPELEHIYNSYINRHHLASSFFVKQVRSAAAGILDAEPDSELSTDSTEELIVSSAIISGLSRLLAEKLLLLDNVTDESTQSDEIES